MITEKRKKYLEEYRSKPENKEKQRLASRKWARANPLKVRQMKVQWKKDNPDKVKTYSWNINAYYRQKRIECLNYYGGGQPKCVCCGENEIMFLALDHIGGGGNKHRKGKGNMFVWAIKNDFPPLFQILCHNCNMAKGFYGSCPHGRASVLSPTKID